MSSLVEPLVAPLVTPLVGGRGRRTGIVRSRLAASALLMTAVMAVSTDTAQSLPDTSPEPTVERNAHRPPAPIPMRDVARVFGHAKAIEVERVRLVTPRPGLAPRFEWDAIQASRLRHATDLSAATAHGLVRARSLDRLGRSRPPTFTLFGSGEHRSGSSAPVAV